MRSGRSRALLVVGIGVIALVALVAGRAVTDARSELDLARSFRGDGSPLRAVEHYRRALRWSFPWSPYEPEAAAELGSLAEELEAAGDVGGALLAWRSLVGGMAASRSPFETRDPRREHAKDEIARLLALRGGEGIDANLAPERLEAKHRQLLDREVAPDPFWGTVLVLGFALWLGGLVLLIGRGFDPQGRLVWSAARGPASGALVGLVSFVLGLLFA